MISIIICSRKKAISEDLSINIEKTIGCEYELIVIDNSENKYSIFEAYNLGIKRSKGDYWCFIHDDILFHTPDWGFHIQEIFERNSQIGLIGIAGAKIKSIMPSGWWDYSHSSGDMVVNVIHRLTDNNIEKQYHGFETNNDVEVVSIDGVFMASRANMNVSFNEKLKGFHNYDLNLCIEYKRLNYKIIVTNRVLIEHFSVGNIDEVWLKSALNFHKLYKKSLPLYLDDSLTADYLRQLEFRNGRLFCIKLIQHGLKKQAILFWLRLLMLKPISKIHFSFIKQLFFNY
jgi:glycosyltransferase involved in cell wall biosynthesis